MNKNNLSWVDNKVFNKPGTAQIPPARPYMDTAPAQYNAPATTVPAPMPTGVSPATYQDTAAKAPSGVSPAEMAPKAPEPADLSPAAYQNMMPNNSQMGFTPMQNMSPPAMPSGMTGVSPAQYTAPGMGAPTPPVIFPVQTGQPSAMSPDTGMGTQSTLTRTTTQAVSPISIQGPPTVLDPGYIPAYLRTQIGKRVRAEFNIGTNLYTDRTGILKEVGISYFVLEDNVTHVLVMCDLYSLKFLSSL
jgi:hypothetical protein